MDLSFKYIGLENPLILLVPAADRPVLLHIVTVNLLAIILFIKNRILRTRSMYLVISLTVESYAAAWLNLISYRDVAL